MQERYDAIIVGGGPAGCVMAARLAEDGMRRVLLMEAGPDYGADPSAWPAVLIDPVGTQHFSHTWGFYDRPDDAGRRMHLPRARVLGGCSAVNGCVWLRGSRRDYDYWRDLGNPGWGFDDLLPYFRRAETDLSGPPQLHGQDGPVMVTRVSEDTMSPFDWAVIETAEELGFPLLDDLNGSEDQVPVVGRVPKNIFRGIRYSAPFSYLALARDRPNFELRADTLVDTITFDGPQVTGIRTAAGEEIQASRVILTAGSYCSPAVLLRSGVGPADDLRTLGVEPLIDLPGVGEHLMDHPVLMRESRITQWIIAPEGTPHRVVTGQTIVKARSRQVDEEIDLHLTPVVEFNDERSCWILLFGISLMYARSRGHVRLTSPDPRDPPDIDLRYFSDPADLEALCDGVELMQTIVRTGPLASMLSGPLYPEEQPVDREHLRRIVRARIQTTHHPSSTCRMGPDSDPLAVVDRAGRVRSVSNLWIGDPSIFPSGPRANIHYATVAVAERVAELVRVEASLATSD